MGQELIKAISKIVLIMALLTLGAYANKYLLYADTHERIHYKNSKIFDKSLKIENITDVLIVNGNVAKIIPHGKEKKDYISLKKVHQSKKSIILIKDNEGMLTYQIVVKLNFVSGTFTATYECGSLPDSNIIDVYTGIFKTIE